MNAFVRCGSFCELDQRMQESLNQILELGFGEAFKRDVIMNALESCSYDADKTIRMLLATKENEPETEPVIPIQSVILQSGATDFQLVAEICKIIDFGLLEAILSSFARGYLQMRIY